MARYHAKENGSSFDGSRTTRTEGLDGTAVSDIFVASNCVPADLHHCPSVRFSLVLDGNVERLIGWVWESMSSITSM